MNKCCQDCAPLKTCREERQAGFPTCKCHLGHSVDLMTPKEREEWFEKIGSEAFRAIQDGGTTTVTIPTPNGWKCERPNCPTDFLHTHSTYPPLTSAHE